MASSGDEDLTVMRLRACIAGIDQGTVTLAACRSVMVEAVLRIRDETDPVFTTPKRRKP
jgi:hypothetical protein